LTSFADFNYVADTLWSPDGKLIYFSYRSQGKWVSYVIDSDGGTARRTNLGEGRIVAFSHDGKWMYFLSKRSGADQIWKVAAAGGTPVQLTTAGGYQAAVESDDGHYLYFMRSGATGKTELWKKTLDGGEETRVLDSVLNDNFAVVEHGIYFIPDSKPFSIRYLGFESGYPTTIASLPRPPGYGFSVSPDRRSLLFADRRASTSDLMLVEHFR
jgi:hypothetical protein